MSELHNAPIIKRVIEGWHNAYYRGVTAYIAIVVTLILIAVLSNRH